MLYASWGLLTSLGSCCSITLTSWDGSSDMHNLLTKVNYHSPSVSEGHTSCWLGRAAPDMGPGRSDLCGLEGQVLTSASRPDWHPQAAPSLHAAVGCCSRDHTDL
jgi:hypothetical protein